MTDANGWPDASKPGVPLNPERDGWHWLSVLRGVSFERPRFWHAKIARWELSDGECIAPHECAERWRYLGPCLTPAEVAAREAADALARALDQARAEEREACVEIVREEAEAEAAHAEADDRDGLRGGQPKGALTEQAAGIRWAAPRIIAAIRARGKETKA